MAKKRLDEYGRSVLLEAAPRWSEGIFMGVPVDDLDLTIEEMKGLAVLMRDMVAAPGASVAPTLVDVSLGEET